ncbi:MAG TPA: LysR family transcriptional regulator [Candidatus Binatia bacterium]|nr:LysR family transcriptional regulator [Candidatus Binatia bacterium]
MKLKQLEIFSAVAKYQNLTRTAEALRITQPAVSKGLKALEKHLKAVLYMRSGHGIRLTEKGWTLLPLVDVILKNRDSVEKRFVPDHIQEESRSFTVGGSYGPAASFLPSLMAKFRKNHPGVQTSIRAGDRNFIEQLVLKGQAEIGLVTVPINSPSLVLEPYRPEKLAAFVSVDHPLARKRKVSLSDMFKSPLVIRGERDVHSRIKEILALLETQGYTPQIAAFYDLPDAVKEAVRKKMGTGFLYADLIKLDLQRGDFKLLKVKGLELNSQSFIIYHKERPLSENAREFLKLLRAARKHQSLIREPLSTAHSWIVAHILGLAGLPLTLSAVC